MPPAGSHANIICPRCSLLHALADPWDGSSGDPDSFIQTLELHVKPPDGLPPNLSVATVLRCSTRVTQQPVNRPRNPSSAPHPFLFQPGANMPLPQKMVELHLPRAMTLQNRPPTCHETVSRVKSQVLKRPARLSHSSHRLQPRLRNEASRLMPSGPQALRRLSLPTLHLANAAT